MHSAARFTILLVVLLLAGAAARGGEDYEQKLKAADGELKKLVNSALDRGAEWLANRQNPNGSFSSAYGGYLAGPTALCGLALLHSGVPHDSDAVRKTFDHLRTLRRDSPTQGFMTYSASVLIMALAEYGRCAGGPGRRFHLGEPDLEWMTSLTERLVKAQTRGGAWRYPSGGFDHSNSQYALLALKEARSVGIDVPDETFVKALRHFLKQQQKNGKRVPRYKESGGDGVYAAGLERVPGSDRARGWGYTGPNPVSGSMTTAGAAAVAVCTSEIRSRKNRQLLAAGEQSLRDGLAWLGENFSVTDNPRMGPIWHYYYLYGLERAGVLGRVVYMGKHRWYAEGARYLVNSQRPDGSWPGMSQQVRAGGPFAGGEVVEQCFALLFLARATSRALAVATEQPLLDLSSAADLPDEEFGKLFEAAFAKYDLLTEEDRKERARDFALMGPRVIPLLLRGLASGSPATRKKSVTILRAATGLAFGYDPAADTGERERAFDDWTAWYLRSRAALALDRAARRIR